MEKATHVIRNTFLGSPQKHVLDVIEYLNANNAILSKMNSELVALTRASKKPHNGKQVINKARFLNKEDADRLRKEEELKEQAAEAARSAQEAKKKEMTQKRAQVEAEKADRAVQRAEARNQREINAEQTRLAKIDRRLFT